MDLLGSFCLEALASCSDWAYSMRLELGIEIKGGRTGERGWQVLTILQVRKQRDESGYDWKE